MAACTMLRSCASRTTTQDRAKAVRDLSQDAVERVALERVAEFEVFVVHRIGLGLIYSPPSTDHCTALLDNGAQLGSATILSAKPAGVILRPLAASPT
jgi:hypothetical protein